MFSEFDHINEIATEGFRDKMATVDDNGKRKWIYAQKPKGKFYNIKTLLSVIYFAIFFGLPFINIDGRPLFLFNVPKAHFIIFGKIFWPQDFFIFGLTMVTFVFFIILFTAAFGRLFCGWACPQTNFMELMFRRVEYLILGDAAAQRKLKNDPWNTNKIIKVCFKHFVFFMMAFVISNFFLAYIIGVKELEKIVTEPISQHVGGLTAIVIFSYVFYAVYAYFREQVCIVICPYGRLQSVLMDKNSMIVAYDYKRGEQRGHVKKGEDETKLGDCIDCYQCVRVCPTGIDIRNGLQMECVGCTACIDACNGIMDKIGRPRGLVRYASENSIANGERLHYTKRMKFYTALCAVVLSLLSMLLITRKDIDATVMRAPGMLFQEKGTDSVQNLYNVKVINKTTREIPMTVKLEDNDGSIMLIGKPYVKVENEGQGWGEFFITLAKKNIHKRSTIIKLGIYNGNQKISVVTTKFLAPVSE